MANMNTHSHDLYVGKFEASSKLKTISFALMAIGFLTFVIGMIKNQDRLWTSYLVAFFYFSGLGLGGLFFAAINHVAKAGWSVTVRRLAESMTSFIPAILFGGLIMAFFGMKHLYPWADSEKMAANPILQAKAPYLNTGFFIIRLLVFAGGMFLFKWFIVGNSIHQDQDGKPERTLKNVGLSVAFILFFAVTFSLFSVDLLMSLLPTWYSTIFGIYCFSGLIQATFAVLAIAIIYLRENNFVKGYLTVEHQHDVVKYMKGFTVFWAYIAFSQFMLIWYANIPEETEYYIMRSMDGWLWISISLLVLRFIVPFLVLLPRNNKRNNGLVIAVSVLVLVMQYVDIYWMVYPNFNHGHIVFGAWEIGIFLGFLGFFIYGLMTFWSKFSLVPLKDPRLHEAVDHHVTY